MSWLRLPLALSISLLLTSGALPTRMPGASAQTSDLPLVQLDASGTPLLTGGGGRVGLTVTLDQPAHLRLRVADFDGRTVRVLHDAPAPAGRMRQGWSGRDETGDPVEPGPYRIVATADADGVSARAQAWVTLADRALYPAAPGLITVAVDPGHGGDFDGAVGVDGTREADLNLDIGLRLARMLEGAGARVLLTRAVDGHANDPPEERTGDGRIDGDDELAARPDLANGARADLFLSIHNNIAVNTAVGGPSTFFFDERPFASRSARLARLVQAAMTAALDRFANGAWRPHDHGVLVYPYYVLRGYDPPRLKRPTQMPGVLSEGLFLSNERELALLRRPIVRGAMAVAYYDAVARYLSRRGPHVGYALVSEPVRPSVAGERAEFEVEVRNQGTRPIRGWRLGVDAVGAPARYVGRLGRGQPVGSVRIPRLAPGDTAVVAVTVKVPAEAREWMLVFDARDAGGRRAAALGAPPLQVRLTTTEPAVSDPAPSPSPSVAAS